MPRAGLSQLPFLFCRLLAPDHIPAELPEACLAADRRRQAVDGKIPKSGPEVGAFCTLQWTHRIGPWPYTENQGDRRPQAREDPGEHRVRSLSKIPGSCPSSIKGVSTSDGRAYPRGYARPSLVLTPFIDDGQE